MKAKSDTVLFLYSVYLLSWVALAAAALREEKESAALDTELELRGDELVNEAVVPFGDDDREEVEAAIGDDFEAKLSLKEDEDEALLSAAEAKKVPMQLAIAGRPNVGKSTLLNSLLREERVLTGPEPGLTRDSIRVEFEYEGQKIFLVSQFFLTSLLLLQQLCM